MTMMMGTLLVWTVVGILLIVLLIVVNGKPIEMKTFCTLSGRLSQIEHSSGEQGPLK